ncbi:MAG: beta-ketoacyl-[acyl-carrier-protein] synthase family protein [Proteobacteria bacterium]|nr:beta-ketoacyl-[acyl-carrier-protein] synthase family protein [Pseudomonadota bacterium]
MIAVTGLGAVSAFGHGVEPLFAALASGQSAIALREGTPVSALADGPHLGSDLAISAVREALGDCPTVRLGLVGASTAGDMVVGEPAYARTLAGAPPNEHFFWTQLCSRPTDSVADAFGITGPRLTLSNACVSGAAAIGVAAAWIRSGRVDAAVAFGVDALCALTTSGFASLGLISSTGARPFDSTRDGITLGEGAGAVLLESKAHAEARGATPIAWLAGYGNAMDNHHMTAPAPDGRGLRRAIAQAVTGPVDYINAHGTGTKLNDASEAGVFGDLFPGTPVSSIKGAIGHTLGAAGAIDAVVAALALDRGVLPVNAGLTTPEFALEFVKEPTRVPLSTALTVNSAFGGNSTALYLVAP